MVPAHTITAYGCHSIRINYGSTQMRENHLATFEQHVNERENLFTQADKGVWK
jgi:hypothetical protein